MPVNIYAILGPLVLALVVIEFCYCLYKKNGFYDFQDSMSSLGTAIINQCMNVLVAFIIMKGFSWLHTNFGFTEFKPSITTYVLCFIGVDFLFYWFHRMGHSINFLWAAHMPHHSTEELNYAVALRASVTQRIMSFLFYWPLVVVGFTPVMVIEVVAFHLVLQFVPHTRVVPKMPKWIESWMNTPSHHRVHHGLNRQYLDKNYGGFLIIWDKLFGTWEEEVEEVFYGVTRPTRTWDPTAINMQWWKYLWQDAVNTPRLIDKIKVWFMPLGWRPPGVPPREQMPIWTKETQVKFQSTPLKGSYFYIFFQLILALGMMFLIIDDKSPLLVWQKVLGSFLLYAQATAWSGLMESKNWIYKFETVRILLTGAFLFPIFNALGAETYTIPMISLSLASLIWLYILKTTNQENVPSGVEA